MASTDTKTKPATKQVKPAVKKPATEKPAVVKGVGIKELAAELDRTPKSVRAAIRRINGGPMVGKGGTYNWPSKSDPDYKKLLKQLKGSGTATKVEKDEDAA